MPDQTNDQPNNDLLRFLIREAVERETVNRIGPINQALQVSSGKQTQLDRDFGALLRRVDELESIVKGNPALNLVGLAQQIQDTQKAISGLRDKLDQWEDRFTGYTNQIRGARYALGALVVVGAFSAFPQLMLLLRATGLIP